MNNIIDFLVNDGSDYCVYCHKNIVNGKMYIGMTKQNQYLRWRDGKSHSYSKNVYFLEDINKYGWNGFEHKVLVSGLTKHDASIVETLLIEKYNTYDRNYGYNIAIGFSRKQSEETKRKICDTLDKKYNGNYISTSIPVVQYDLNGNVLAEFSSTKEASRVLNINRRYIGKCCNGQQIVVNKKYIFRHKGDAFDKYRTTINR